MAILCHDLVEVADRSGHGALSVTRISPFGIGESPPRRGRQLSMDWIPFHGEGTGEISNQRCRAINPVLMHSQLMGVLELPVSE